MTKVTVLGKEDTSKNLKPIEFIYEIDLETEEKPITTTASLKPDDFDNIMLIRPAFKNGLDFMMAWDDTAKASRGFYLGHFNDGVVE